jgi:hypothetical protein
MLVAVDGRITGYVAVEPALMVAAAVPKTGAEPEFAVALSTSNCSAFDTPPGAGVCTLIWIVPAVAVLEAGT